VAAAGQRPGESRPGHGVLLRRRPAVHGRVSCPAIPAHREDGRVTVSEAPAAPTFTATDPIQVQSISRWYGNVVAVNEVTFSLGQGITGLLGPNGAGKTTLLHMLAGLLQPSSGRATILGMPAWRNPAIYRHVGFVPEREAVYPFLTG